MSLSEEELEAFLAETDEGLATLETAFLALERDPADGNALSRAFRVMHTIKGTSGFFEFHKIETLAHAAENLLARLREQQVVLNAHRAALLLMTVDGLRAMVASVRRDGTDGAAPAQVMIDQLGLAGEDSGDRGGDGDGDVDGRDGGDSDSAGEGLPAFAPAPLAHPASVGPPAGASPRPSASSAESSQATLAPATLAPAMPAAAMPAAGESNIRVDVARLDGLMNMVGELVLIRNQIAQQASDGQVPSAEVLQYLNGVTAQLQDGVLKVRMQPMSSLWSSLPRIVRDLAASLGKQVDLIMEGADTELDRAVIDSVRDPLVHSVRNAIDHGLETPDVRRRAGKSPRGRLHLRAWHEAGVVRITIADDGAGINLDRVRRKAVERGILDENGAGAASEQELVDLLFLAGFSTADAVTNISGRGVGMDVVRAAVEGAGGRVQLVTRAGAGTTLTLTIPLTLAIISGLVIRSGATRYVVSRASLDEVVQVDRWESFHGVPMLRLRDALIPLVDLKAFLGGQVASGDPSGGTAVIVRGDGRCFGLLVDEVLDLQEIVVKPLPRWFRETNVYSGLTILGDGSVSVILDIAGVGRRARVRPEESARDLPVTRAATDENGRADQVVVISDGRGGRGALRLSDVVRIEEVGQDTLEQVEGRATMQYRGAALPLVDLRTAGVSAPLLQGRVKVVVTAADGRRLGIVVDDVLDIADATPCDGTTADGRPIVVVNGHMAALQDLPYLAAVAGARHDNVPLAVNAAAAVGLGT